MADRDYRYGGQEDRSARYGYQGDKFAGRGMYMQQDNYRGGYGSRQPYYGYPPMRTQKPSFWTPEKTYQLKTLAEQKLLPDGSVDFGEIAQLLGASKDSCMNKFVSINEPVWTDVEIEELAEWWTKTNGKLDFDEMVKKLAPHTLHGIKMKLETICKNRRLVPTYRIPREGALPCLHEMQELCEFAIQAKKFDICEKMAELVDQLKKQLKQE